MCKNEAKKHIIDQLIRVKIGPVRFRKYELKDEEDEAGDICKFNDYDILIKDNNGKFKFAGFVTWNEYGIDMVSFGDLLEGRYDFIDGILYGVFGIGELDKLMKDYIIDILYKRVKGGRIKNVCLPKKK